MVYVPKLPDDLTQPERDLTNACARGEFCVLGDGKLPPEGASMSLIIRAEVIRFLALGGSDKHPVDPRGVQLFGALIDGVLDLENADVPVDLFLLQCRFNKPLILRSAQMRTVSLSGNAVPGIEGDGAILKGDLCLQDSFCFKGEVRFLGAQVGGDFACSSGRFNGQGGDALNCDGINVAGAIFLDEGFSAKGAVRFLGAQVGGNFDCVNGRFDGKGGYALSCDRINVIGDVFLEAGFSATGGVRFLGAQVGGDFYCANGWFEGREGDALNLQKASIDGGLLLDAKCKINGVLNLVSARVGDIIDDIVCWPEPGRLILDGFRYERISALSPKDATSRLEWLERQYKPHLTDDFRPQPYEQLAKVLREMGYNADAREISIAKQDRLRANAPTRLMWWWLTLLKYTIGYGYKPWKVVLPAILIVLLGIGVYGQTWVDGHMVPAKERIHLQLSWEEHCRGKSNLSREACVYEMFPEYPRYGWITYSLDVFLPIVNLHQEEFWLPSARTWWGMFARWFMWLQIAAGWVLTSLGVAGLTGIVKKD